MPEQMDPNALELSIRCLHDEELGVLLHQDEVQRVLCEVGAYFADHGHPNVARAFASTSELFEFERGYRVDDVKVRWDADL